MQHTLLAIYNKIYAKCTLLSIYISAIMVIIGKVSVFRTTHKGVKYMENKKREYTQAQNKATQKYIKNNYDSVMLRMPKGKKEQIKAHAESRGESLNGFVNRAIDETIDRESK